MKNIVFDELLQQVLLAAEYKIVEEDGSYNDIAFMLPEEMEEKYFYQFLALVYVKNEKVTADFFKAAEYHKIACDLGNMESCYSIASMYNDGDLEEKDYLKAMHYYEKSAQLGECRAFLKLGLMYDSGLGVKKDFSKAAKYYEEACRFAGNDDVGCSKMHEACYLLAVMYEDGDGVTQDFSKAALLYQKAIDYGNTIAYRNLAIMHILGKGVSVNIDKAKQLLQDSCKQNDLLSCDLLKKLNAQT